MMSSTKHIVAALAVTILLDLILHTCSFELVLRGGGNFRGASHHGVFWSHNSCCVGVEDATNTIQAFHHHHHRHPTTAAFSALIATGKTRLYAKPPPTAGFDLQAIEAFEEELFQREHQALDYDLDENFLFDDDDLDNNDDDDDDASTTKSQVMRMQTYIVPPQLAKKRIDAVVAQLAAWDAKNAAATSTDPPDGEEEEEEEDGVTTTTTDAAATATAPSRSYCGQLVTQGRVTLVLNDGTRQILDQKSIKVKAGQVLEVDWSLVTTKEPKQDIVPQDLDLQILHEDEHMIVLNKAAGMVVHPAAGNWNGTVVNALAYYLVNKSPYGSGEFVGSSGSTTTQDNGESATTTTNETSTSSTFWRPGVVHRLDKGTTGILVVAKTRQALHALSAAFAERRVRKTYLALTVGNPGRSVTIDKPIGRHPIHRQRMRVVPDAAHRAARHVAQYGDGSSLSKAKTTSTSVAGRHAVSHVDTMGISTSSGNLCLVRVRIETGRTHQIRVHLQDRGTPVAGDDVYGVSDWNDKLHNQHGVDRPLLHAYRLQVPHPVTEQWMEFVAPMPEDMRRIVAARGIAPEQEKEKEEDNGFTAGDQDWYGEVEA